MAEQSSICTRLLLCHHGASFRYAIIILLAISNVNIGFLSGNGQILTEVELRLSNARMVLMNNRVGIYPGTFDPIHIGHVTFARETMDKLSLDRVLFIPERVHLRKTGVSDFYARIDYANETLKDIPQFEVIELTSVPQTMTAVSKELSELFEQNHIVMLIGSDNLKSLASWVDIADFLMDVELAIGLRGDDTVETLTPSITDLEKKLGYPVKYTMITTPHGDVSSTKIRSSVGYEPLEK